MLVNGDTYKAVLILHYPSRSGILRYSFALFKTLKKLMNDEVRLFITPATFMKVPSF